MFQARQVALWCWLTATDGSRVEWRRRSGICAYLTLVQGDGPIQLRDPVLVVLSTARAISILRYVHRLRYLGSRRPLISHHLDSTFQSNMYGRDTEAGPSRLTLEGPRSIGYLCSRLLVECRPKDDVTIGSVARSLAASCRR